MEAAASLFLEVFDQVSVIKEFIEEHVFAERARFIAAKRKALLWTEIHANVKEIVGIQVLVVDSGAYPVDSEVDTNAVKAVLAAQMIEKGIPCSISPDWDDPDRKLFAAVRSRAGEGLVDFSSLHGKDFVRFAHKAGFLVKFEWDGKFLFDDVILAGITK